MNIRTYKSVPSLINFAGKQMPPKKSTAYTREKGTIIETQLNKYLCLGDKPFGVEPGFLAIELDNHFIEILKKNFQILGENKIMPADLDLQDNDMLLNKICKMLSDQCEIASRLANFIITNNDKLIFNPPFIIWMFKQDYADPDNNDKVEIPKIRYEKLGRIDESPRSKTKRTEENLNAIRECIANDISTYFGIPTQIQQLIRSTYTNGELKLMTVCQLVSGYKDIGKAYKLAGDAYKPTEKKGFFENYLYEINAAKGSKSYHVPDIGVLLALLLLIEERDFIGAYGQNLGIVNDNIFMIDLGKAFQSNLVTKILDTLQTNGQFEQPLSWLPLDSIRRHTLYRNSSVLYDSPFTEIMTGFHMLNKLARGIEPSNAIADSYGNHFKQLMNQVKPKGLTQIFEIHINNLKSLKRKCKTADQEKEIDSYISCIETTRAFAFENANQILNIFKERLDLLANEVELLSNLEKLTSEKIIDQTHNAEHRISHLQIDMESRVEWKLIKNQKGECALHFNSIKIDPIHCLEILQDFLNRKNIDLNKIILHVDQVADWTRLHISVTDLKLLCQYVSEKFVHEYRIPLSSCSKVLAITKITLHQYKEEQGQRIFSFYNFLSDNKRNSCCLEYCKLFHIGLNNSSHENAIELNFDTRSRAEKNIIQLIAVLDLLSTDLKTQLLLNLTCDSCLVATKRIKMLIRDELQLHYHMTNPEMIEFFLSKVETSLKDNVRADDLNIEEMINNLKLQNSLVVAH